MTITVTQSGGEPDNNANSTSRASASDVTAGGLVVFKVWRWADAANDPFVAGDCTQTAGTATLDTIALDAEENVNTAAGWFNVGIWSAIVTSGGSCTLTVAGGAANYWGNSLTELGGNWDATRLEDSSVGSGTGADNPTTGADTSAGEAIFMAVCVIDAATPTITPDAAYTEIFESQGAGSSQAGAAMYQIVGSGTTDTAIWTSTANAGWAAAQVVYMEVPGGGAAQNQLAWTVA